MEFSWFGQIKNQNNLIYYCRSILNERSKGMLISCLKWFEMDAVLYFISLQIHALSPAFQQQLGDKKNITNIKLQSIIPKYGSHQNRIKYSTLYPIILKEDVRTDNYTAAFSLLKSSFPVGWKYWTRKVVWLPILKYNFPT